MSTLAITPNPQQPQTQPIMDPRLVDVANQFPRLQPYLNQTQVIEGKKSSPNDDRVLEFYPPWESENPNPGKITLQLFDQLKGGALTNALGGDLLHHIGAIDPKTKKPIDPQYYALKQQVINARTPRQAALDRRIYANEVRNEGERRSYQDWLDQSRIDAYIRGYVTPDMTGKYPDEWRKNGFYDEPAMKNAVESIKKYVTSK